VSGRTEGGSLARPYAALVLVQALFASLAVLGRLVLPVVGAGFLVTLRIFGAAVALALVAAVRGGPWIKDRATLGRLAASGLLGITLNQTLFLYGLEHTTAVNATILVTTAPVFTVLGSILLKLERPSPGKLAGIGLAGAGAIYLVGPDRITLDPAVALGNFAILVGMICYAAYLHVSRPLVRRLDPVLVGAYVMSFAALGLLPVAVPSLLGAEPARVGAGTWALVAYIVLGPTVGAYFLNLWALRRASSNTVAAFIYLQPLFAAIGAAVLLPGERLTPRTILAGAGIFTGLGLVLRAEATTPRGVGGVSNLTPPPSS
jgi:drug/metabolite transporter (DMT)-like permease